MFGWISRKILEGFLQRLLPIVFWFVDVLLDLMAWPVDKFLEYLDVPFGLPSAVIDGFRVFWWMVGCVADVELIQKGIRGFVIFWTLLSVLKIVRWCLRLFVSLV